MTDDIQYGWQCPLCKVVHAPYINKCRCQAPESKIVVGPAEVANLAARLAEEVNRELAKKGRAQ